jgi:copper transport protein
LKVASGRPLLTGLVLLLALVVLALSPARTSAHALLASADPGINASLREAPSIITASFTEPLEREFSTLEVYNPAGERLDSGQAIFNDADSRRMSIEVEQLEPAVYTVVWKTLSQVDGHTYVGSYTFTVLNPDGSTPAGAAFVFSGDLGAGGAPAGVDGIFKALGLIAGVVLAGAFIFVAWAALPSLGRLAGEAVSERRALMRLLAAVTFVSLACAAVSEVYLLIEQLNQLNGGLEVLDEVVFETQWGRWFLYRVALLLSLLVVALVVVRVEASKTVQWLCILGGLLAAGQLLGSSLISHGAAASQGEFWGTLSDFMHLLFVAVWIGSLGFLLLVWLARRSAVAPRRWPPYFASLLGRFSMLAASSVVLVLVTGVTNAVIEFPTLSSIADTDYGVVFIVKMWIVGALFAVGAVNAFFLRPAVIDAAESRDASEGRFERRLSWTVRGELAIAVAALVASGVLTQLPTARVLAQQEATTVDLSEPQRSAFTGSAPVGEGSLDIFINPAQVGLNRYQVDFTGETGEITDVLLDLEHETAGTSQVRLEREDSDSFAIDGSFFGLDGPWSVTTQVRRAGLDDVISDFNVQVFPAPPPLPTGADDDGPFALPAPQLDWNTVGGLWLLAAGVLLLLWREPLAQRFHGSSTPALGCAAFAMFTGFVLIAGASHSEPGADLSNPVPLTDESVTTGAMLYAANCAQCHGENGRGDGPLASELRPPPANFLVHVPFHTDGTLFSWITDGIPGTAMPAWQDELTDEQRWHLVNYLRANYNEPPPTEPAEIRLP